MSTTSDHTATTSHDQHSLLVFCPISAKRCQIAPSSSNMVDCVFATDLAMPASTSSVFRSTGAGLRPTRQTWRAWWRLGAIPSVPPLALVITLLGLFCTSCSHCLLLNTNGRSNPTRSTTHLPSIESRHIDTSPSQICMVSALCNCQLTHQLSLILTLCR